MHTAKSPRSGTVFVKKCKFGFPRPIRDTSCLNCLEDSLKTKGKLYHLKRTEDEVKINDYNPLLLKVWKANMDIQYFAESTMALAHYVSGYVTKAERSHVQDIWQEVSDNKSLYSRLWSFGVRCLRTRECELKKPVTCYLATTSVINLARSSG